MTIPLSRKARGIERTMLESMRAIMDRLKRQAWISRQGRPDMKSLPNDGPQAISVWVFPMRTRTGSPGQASNWHSEAFSTEWMITIVTSDTSADPNNTSPERIIEAAGAVLEALTGTADGNSLDGSVNWSDDYKAEYGIATAGGDRSVLVAVITLAAHHPIFPNRVPPVAS